MTRSRSPRLPLPIFALGLLAFSSVAARADVVRTLNQDLPVGEASTISIDFPVGNLNVEGFDGNSVNVDMKVECSPSRKDCQKVADKVAIASRTNGRKMEVNIKGPRGDSSKDFQLSARIQVPRALLVSVDMGVGNLSVIGLEQAVEIDLGVGDADVRLPEGSVRSVNLKAGVGEATLHLKSGRIQGTGFVHQGLKWTGSGSANVEISVGVGDVDLTLE
jgi:hypothetical protein